MITEIAQTAVTDSERLALQLVDALSDAEMELEDTLEQYDALMYGSDAVPDDEGDRAIVIADLLWDARDLRGQADELMARVQDFADAVGRALDE